MFFSIVYIFDVMNLDKPSQEGIRQSIFGQNNKLDQKYLGRKKKKQNKKQNKTKQNKKKTWKDKMIFGLNKFRQK